MHTVSFAVRRRLPRSGFTLIELLVVMAIIGVLASLTVGAVMTVRASQEKRFTETTISKLASALDQQWKAVIDQAREDPLPLEIVAKANGDLRRARVIYFKVRLKQEFPTSFYRALNPTPSWNPGVPAKASYQKALAGVTANSGNNNGPPPAPWESSACLYLALKQGRRGMTSFNADEMIDANYTRTQTVQLQNSGTATFTYFVDAWGNPLRYYPFPTGNDELNNPPYINTALPINQRDPQDPEGTLHDPVWVTTSNALTVFATNVHPLKVGTNSSVTTQAPYLVPVVASAGKDGQWGIDDEQMNLLPGTNPATGLPYAQDTNDNIYSYRLRQFGQRGDR